MRPRGAFEAILILITVLGAIAVTVLVGVAVLHHTRLDTLTSGKSPLHGFGWGLAIPIAIGAVAALLLMARRGGRS